MLSRNHPLRICGGLAIRLYRYSFNRLRIGRMRRAGATIEGTSYIDPRCKLLHHRNISIGDKCCIGKAELYALDKIEIGSRTLIGDRVYLCTGSHDLYSKEFRLITKPIRIGRGVWIATGATILPGVSIGDGAVVGAFSVVTKDVPAGGVVAGNPARLIRTGRPDSGFDPVRLASIDFATSIERLRVWCMAPDSLPSQPHQ